MTDLAKFQFPEVSDVDIVFSTFDTIPELLREAEARGFAYTSGPYNELFSKLIFRGGKVKFKDGLDEDFKTRAWLYCRALMASWTPRHEHKEAVCAMLLSELAEPELDTV
jgi:hypothetical protein